MYVVLNDHGTIDLINQINPLIRHWHCYHTQYGLNVLLSCTNIYKDYNHDYLLITVANALYATQISAEVLSYVHLR